MIRTESLLWGLIDIPPGNPRQVLVTVGFKISMQALRRSPSDRNRVPDLARKVANVFDSLVKCPKTNLAAIGNALALVANEMEIVLREMENKAGSSTGQCDEEPSRSNSEGTPEEERTLAEEIICVVHGVVQLIKELTELVKTWDDADDLPKLIGNMEDLNMLTEVKLGARTELRR
ncbi:hypothetical protein CDL15_Pgr023936 [Punica granatum]|uniref:Uncharacterized protein n=1 Tax=Punica granatum TaxID=22663 RepID=A0A218XW83_PUNGR|nr:hypothetical protein CDL15_Pgr023936 [Punica granatum]